MLSTAVIAISSRQSPRVLLGSSICGSSSNSRNVLAPSCSRAYSIVAGHSSGHPGRLSQIGHEACWYYLSDDRREAGRPKRFYRERGGQIFRQRGGKNTFAAFGFARTRRDYITLPSSFTEFIKDLGLGEKASERLDRMKSFTKR